MPMFTRKQGLFLKLEQEHEVNSFSFLKGLKHISQNPLHRVATSSIFKKNP